MRPGCGRILGGHHEPSTMGYGSCLCVLEAATMYAKDLRGIQCGTKPSAMTTSREGASTSALAISM